MAELTQRSKSARVKSGLGLKKAEPRSSGKIQKHHYVLKAETGAFMYRGLSIKPSYGNDKRAKEVEQAMREIAKTTHAFAD